MAIGLTDDKYYKAIADTIRGNDASSMQNEKYAPNDMAVAIQRIVNYQHYVGTDEGYSSGRSEGYADGKQAEYDRFWDAFQQNGNRTNYRYAFAIQWDDTTCKPKYKIALPSTGRIERMFWQFAVNTSTAGNRSDMTEICKMLDFSQLTNADYCFYSATAKNITVDFSSVTSMKYTFASNDGGGGMDNISLKVTDACTSFSNAFGYSTWLQNLNFMEGSAIAASIDLHWSPLTKASIESVVSALSDTATGQTASFKKTAVEAAFTLDQWNALVASKSNWSFTLA